MKGLAASSPPNVASHAFFLGRTTTSRAPGSTWPPTMSSNSQRSSAAAPTHVLPPQPPHPISTRPRTTTATNCVPASSLRTGAPPQKGTQRSATCVDRWWAYLAPVEPAIQGSMAHDLAGGRRLESETLKGTVIRLGRERGVPTPLNFAIYAALRPFAGGAPAAR